MARQAIYEEGEKHLGQRTVSQTEAERDLGRGTIKSHGGTKSSMEVEWKLNAEATKDRIVKLRIGNESVYVSVEQMYKFLRWV